LFFKFLLATVLLDERGCFFCYGDCVTDKTAAQCLYASGSALLNYYPLLAEAFYSQIPLIVISADRPQSKIDIGDGQTIDKRMYCESFFTMPI
jgi:2-succinyl-5-enolpyruvyl-6-hydroxy-3-cyclohexene-1-carboxylate synthase